MKIIVKGLEEMQRRFAGSPQVIDRHSRLAMDRAVDLTRRNVSTEAPSRSGQLKSAIEGQVKGAGGSIMGIVRPSSAISRQVYPFVQEYGRKSSKFPNIGSIQTKFGVAVNEAFLIARAIARRGTRGYFYMQKGWENSQREVIDLFNRALHDIVRDLED